MAQPRAPGERARTGGSARRRRVRAGAARALSVARPLLSLALRGVLLLATLLAAVRYPTLSIVAGAVWLWVLWPAYAGWRRQATGAGGNATCLRQRVRYLGGHPSLPYTGPGLLRVWPTDGAAVLSVGHATVAFPLGAVNAVALVEGRVELHTGSRGPAAWLIGRIMAAGMGRFAGLVRRDGEDLAILDRSRVLCDLQRDGRTHRLVFVGRAGGGEEIYLEMLLLLRPEGGGRDAGTAGGTRGAGALGGR